MLSFNAITLSIAIISTQVFSLASATTSVAATSTDLSSSSTTLVTSTTPSPSAVPCRGVIPVAAPDSICGEAGFDLWHNSRSYEMGIYLDVPTVSNCAVLCMNTLTCSYFFFHENEAICEMYGGGTLGEDGVYADAGSSGSGWDITCFQCDNAGSFKEITTISGYSLFTGIAKTITFS